MYTHPATRDVVGVKHMCLNNWGGKNNLVDRDITVPKTDLAKQWEGFGTALKPAYEPIIVARKPLCGTVADNVMTYGVGGINIDECRVPTDETIQNHSRSAESSVSKGIYGDSSVQETHQTDGQKLGRFPSNVILTYDDSDFDEVCDGFPVGGKNGSISKRYKMNNTVYGEYGSHDIWDAYDDSGSASRYFYCAKATKKDRDSGCGRNNHPTVKPTTLMQYLVRLVTPKCGTILDPFNGSGSTGKAVMFENRERDANYKYIGIELQEEYLKIAEQRMNWAKDSLFNDSDVQSTKKNMSDNVPKKLF